MVKLERFIDRYAGFFIVLALSIFRNLDRKPGEKKKILLIKLWAIGDSVLTLAMASALKSSLKEIEVDVLTRSKIISVYKASKKIDTIFDMDNKKDFMKLLLGLRKYDVVFDCEPYLNLSAIYSFLLGKERIGFSGQLRSRLYTITTAFSKKQHMVQNYLDMVRAIGVKADAGKLEKLETDRKAKEKVERFISAFRKRKLIIGITPSVAESSKSRMWFEERFARLADRLIRETGAAVIFVDSPSNKSVVDKVMGMMEEKAVSSVGLFNLSETFYLIERCRIFISNDTGPMHIAAAQGCKTIGLFGPNTPVLWRPYGKGNIAIYKTRLPPSIQNDKGIFPDRDREGYMGPISVEDVFSAVKKLL